MTMPFVLQPGEGETVQIKTSRCSFKATGSDTHNHMGLFELTMETEEAGASLHVHKQMTEMFYVVEGEVNLTTGDQTVKGTPGTFVLVPENTPHGFSNASAERAKLLILFCPTDHREDYFRGLAELTKDGRLASEEEMLDLMHRFDQYMVDE